MPFQMEDLTTTAVETDDLLYAILAMDILLRSGVSIEAAINHVATNDYGQVSKEFKFVIADTQRGVFLATALNSSARRVKHDLYHDMANSLARALRTGSGVAATLKVLAVRESQKRKTNYKDYLEKIKGVSNIFLVLSALIPLIIGIIAVIGGIMESMPRGLGRAGLPPHLTGAFLIMDLLILMFIAIYIKIIEPEV